MQFQMQDKLLMVLADCALLFQNHDVPCSASRQLSPLGLTSEKQQDDLQLLLLQLQTSLIGSACIYQGEELGLSDVSDIQFEMKDPWGLNFILNFWAEIYVEPSWFGKRTNPWEASQQQMKLGFP